jgi:miniconductance mechanosensitive channel
LRAAGPDLRPSPGTGGCMREWLTSLGMEGLITELSGLGIVSLVALLVYFLTRWLFVRGLRHLVSSTDTHWDDELVRARVFSMLAYIAPAFVFYYGIGFFPDLSEPLIDLVRRVAVALMVIIGALAFTRLLRAGERIYDRHEEYRERPIKSYLQVLSIVSYLIAGLLVLAALMNRSPWIFVSGIGAMTAVLLLVFRDTILSFVASLQIASNDMIRVGDWIEMPDLGADGDVIEVALHTVKVQNWDKTITSIPTHRLISESFKNWRGMSLSGGRRIKRSVSIDLQSVRFLTDEEITRFESWSLLADYIRTKRREISDTNGGSQPNSVVSANLRRLTNLGTFRAWVWATLRSHPMIHQTGHTLLVRQLPPGTQGIPIEIYCFARDTAWVSYENIQADLFDRILAMVPEFGLCVFQEPAGSDLHALSRQGQEGVS